MTEYKQNGIRLIRQEKNISETELSSILNIDVSVLKSWEIGGGSVPINTILKLMDTFQVTSEMILFSESRKGLNIEKLTEEQIEIIFSLYKIMKNKEKGEI